MKNDRRECFSSVFYSGKDFRFLFTDAMWDSYSIMQDECISDFCDMIHVDQICLMASVETWNAAMHLFNSRKAV